MSSDIARQQCTAQVHMHGEPDLRDEKENAHGMQVSIRRLALCQLDRRYAEGPNVRLQPRDVITKCTGSHTSSQRLEGRKNNDAGLMKKNEYRKKNEWVSEVEQGFQPSMVRQKRGGTMRTRRARACT